MPLELLRQADVQRLGESPIEIGLWVGGRDTPNRFTGTDRWPGAYELAERVKAEQIPRNRFLLERCPWCGTSLLPGTRSAADDDYGFVASPTSFRFRCPSTPCPFTEAIPVQVVDQALYERPPTILIGTVDKFANLARLGAAHALFGAGGGDPPSLIIQDELHLLAGPLGSTVGLYEAAISTLCNADGAPTKVIASTATIRAAAPQVQGLFGRAMAVFPPPGVDADNSYFAHVEESDPGRLYVGVMAPAHSPIMSFNASRAFSCRRRSNSIWKAGVGTAFDACRVPQLATRARPHGHVDRETSATTPSSSHVRTTRAVNSAMTTWWNCGAASRPTSSEKTRTAGRARRFAGPRGHGGLYEHDLRRR